MNSRNLFRFFLRSIGLIILLVILVRGVQSGLLDLLARTDWALFGLAAGMAFPMFWLKSERWRYLLRDQGIQLSSSEAYSVYLRSYYIGIITPARAGEFGKAWHIQQQGYSFSAGLLTTLVDRLLDMIIILIAGLVGIFSLALLDDASRLLTLATIPVLFVLMVLPLWPAGWRFIGRWLPAGGRINRMTDQFAEATALLRWQQILIGLLLTIIAYAITFFECWLVARALQIDVSYTFIIFAVSVAGLVSLLPISLAGLGTRDAAFIILFASQGVASADALAFSILYFGIFGIILSLGGAVLWFRQPLFEKQSIPNNA